MERTLQVLDYAILVISAADGVQAHTETLWRLLRRSQIPTFLFVTKMDLPNPGREALLAELQKHLDEGCVDFTQRDQAWAEAVALREERLLEQYLDTGALSPRDVSGLIRLGKLTPVFFGAALRLEGVEAFLRGLENFTEAPAYGEAFAARVFKIARDHQGNRLTYLKVTGGALSVRAPLTYLPRQGEEGVEEKVTQLRLYSGAKVPDGGHRLPRPGVRRPGPHPDLPRPGPGGGPPPRPRLCWSRWSPTASSCRRRWDPQGPPAQAPPAGGGGPPAPPGVDQAPPGDPRPASWARCRSRSSSASSRTRFGVAVGVDQGRILYKETIAAPVEGVGHYEPLRHYAEVHLLLEPLPQGSGLVLATRCSEDVLAGHWQRLILTHPGRAYPPGGPHRGPYYGPEDHPHVRPAHPKHTEGGDFRQATYRAVRQGLMGAQSVLLEPWYEFTLTLPADQLGRAISDLQTMGGTFASPESDGEWATLTGTAPVSEMKDYPLTVAAYTRGRGKFSCSLHGYAPCHNQKQVVAAAGYDPERDFGTHPGLGVLRPRRGLYGEVGPGAPVHAPGKLPHPGPEGGGPRPRPPGVHPEPWTSTRRSWRPSSSGPSAPSGGGSTSSWPRSAARPRRSPSRPPSSSTSSWTGTT